MFTEKVNKHLLHTNAMTTINQIRITWKIIIFFKEKKKKSCSFPPMNKITCTEEN
ncbi:hypothetical protein JHK82_024494 [Glycine max]|nr:hypothetical protein JHK82_024494 [Glycine max]